MKNKIKIKSEGELKTPLLCRKHSRFYMGRLNKIKFLSYIKMKRPLLNISSLIALTVGYLLYLSP